MENLSLCPGGHIGSDADRYIYTFAGGFTNNFITFVTDMYSPGKQRRY